MIKSLVQFVYLVALILCPSCTGVNKLIKGTWTIDRIVHKNQVLIHEILSNILIFKKDYCIMPTLFEHHNMRSEEEGTWEIINEGELYFLEIKSSNDFFAGRHKICFMKDDKNKLLKMYITSEDLFVECSKVLFNFENNNEEINNFLCK